MFECRFHILSARRTTGASMAESLVRYAKRRDLSEGGIVKALRSIGCDVQTGNDCDLYVQCPRGHAYLLEVKTPGPDAKHRQPIQKRLAEIFGDQYKIVTSSKEALIAIGYYPEAAC